MLSAFTIFFAFGLMSLTFHRSVLLKPFALIGVGLAFYATYLNHGVALSGFSLYENIRLFELIVEIVLFAFVLHEDEDINITQTLFIGASSMLLLEAQMLLSFVLSFESLSLISVILVTQIKTKEQADGAIKMFIAGSLATGILFLGVSFYLLGGGELLEPLAKDTTSFETLGLLLILGGVLYKLTIVPFHGWAADSYALVKHSHAGLLSGVAKTVVAIALFELFAPFLTLHSEILNPLLIGLALTTMTLGNFLALFRKNLALMLSYSSIAHAGYLLLAFVALKSEFAQDGILYISIAYIFMQSAAFLVLDILKKHYGVSTIEELSGFASQNAILAFVFTLQLFSLAGIPLLAGFLGKAVVFYAVVDAGLWWVALIALLNSALSVGYYAWVVKAIYFDELKIQKRVFLGIKLPMTAQFILLGGTLFFGVFAGVVFEF
jgi:NADH-quinone oxidoreductase subunit N